MLGQHLGLDLSWLPFSPSRPLHPRNASRLALPVWAKNLSSLAVSETLMLFNTDEFIERTGPITEKAIMILTLHSFFLSRQPIFSQIIKPNLLGLQKAS